MTRLLDNDDIIRRAAAIVEKANAMAPAGRRELVFDECKKLVADDYDWSDVNLLKARALRELRIYPYGPDPS